MDVTDIPDEMSEAPQNSPLNPGEFNLGLAMFNQKQFKKTQSDISQMKELLKET